jgi:predicted KAP-like P-loop ATPase
VNLRVPFPHLPLQFSVFAHGDAFEVNPIDLISLEVLRVFEPEVFKALPAAKSALTGVNQGRSSRSQREPIEKSELEELVQKASEQTRENVRAIIKSVFPPAAWAFGGSHYDHYSDGWFREHRACHPDLFDKYFQMTIPEGDISLKELEKVVSFASDRAALVEELRSLGKRKLLDVTMDRLEAYREAIGLEHALPFITGLFDIGDELPPGHLGISEVPAVMHATRIIYFYLKREPNLATRGEVLTRCVNDTTGIYLPVYVVAIEGDKVKENREEQARLIDEDGLKRLKDVCAARIAQAAAQGTLLDHPNLAELLGSWQAWSSSGEPREWARALIETPKGLLSFLFMCMRETRSQTLGSYTVRSKWRIDLQSVERFVPVEVVESEVASLSKRDLSEKEKEAVEAFHEAVKRKKEGKTGFSPLDDD